MKKKSSCLIHQAERKRSINRATTTVCSKTIAMVMLSILLCSCAAERKSVLTYPKIYPFEKQREEDLKRGLITRYYSLDYITGVEIVRQLKKIMSKDGRVEVDVKSQTIIVTDEPGFFEGIENMLRETD